MLPSWSSKYSGIPFVTRGRDAKGLDCWGLIKLIYQQELGIQIEDFSDKYDLVSDADAIEGCALVEKQNWIKVGDLNQYSPPYIAQPFDVVLFNIFGRPVHVGLVVCPYHFIHSPEDDMSRFERYTDRSWARRVEGFYRHVAVPSTR